MLFLSTVVPKQNRQVKCMKKRRKDNSRHQQLYSKSSIMLLASGHVVIFWHTGWYNFPNEDISCCGINLFCFSSSKRQTSVRNCMDYALFVCLILLIAISPRGICLDMPRHAVTFWHTRRQ